MRDINVEQPKAEICHKIHTQISKVINLGVFERLQ